MTNKTYKELKIDLLKLVNTDIIDQYIKSQNWHLIQTKFKDSLIYEHNTFDEQIVIPNNMDFDDYEFRIADAIQILSKFENRNPIEILNDLILPPSDVIRFRVNSEQSKNGTISYDEGLNLLQSGRRMIYATIMDLVRPQKFHKKMADKQIDEFMQNCLLGQTERGSFVANLICPIKGQLTLTDNRLITQIGRQTTESLIKSLNYISDSINTNNINKVINPPEGKPQISLNFFEALGDMRPPEKYDKIEIGVTWSPLEKPKFDFRSHITISEPQFEYVEKVIEMLSPEEKPKIEQFIGTVDTLAGDINEEGKIIGNVVLMIYQYDGAIRAKVFLNNIDHEKAVQAYWKNKKISIEGKLIWAPRMKEIEGYKNFKILDN